MSFDAWRKGGQDIESIVADPLFRDLGARDFTLMPDSPAIALGFTLIDLAAVGPRRTPGA